MLDERNAAIWVEFSPLAGGDVAAADGAVAGGDAARPREGQLFVDPRRPDKQYHASKITFIAR